MEITEERWEPDEPSPELLFVRDASDRIRTPLRAARKAAREALTMPRSTAEPGDADRRGRSRSSRPAARRRRAPSSTTRSAATAGSPSSRPSSTR